jgi:regulatory protein
MKITKLVQNKNPFLVNVYIDDCFFQSVDKNFVVENAIYKGKEFSKEEIATLFGKGNINKLYNLVVNRIAARPRSIAETKTYLQQKTQDPSEIEQVIDKLIDRHYLSDYDFANWWVDNRNTFRAKSRRELQAELSNKGIAKEIVNQVLSESFSASDEETNIAELINKKWPTLKAKDKAKDKLIAYLQRKGYSWDLINKSISELI